MIPSDYLEGLERAGASVVRLAPRDLDPSTAGRVVSSLDGLMLCGGRDVEPARYGQEPLVTTEKPDHRRDHTEDLLLRAAIERELPLLGICRGAQMLNVHRGGTLLQHVPDVIGDSRYQKGQGEFSMMEVDIVPGTALHHLYQGASRVGPAAMYHHQAIDRVGAGLRVSAWSPDRLVEAVELEDYPFGIAVQWHPEKTLDDLRLFEGVVRAANEYREKRQ